MNLHRAYGKMPEETSKWQTKSHPAFKPLRAKKSMPNKATFTTYDKSLMEDAPANLWIALEKLHGSNMSFLCDGASVKSAKRETILEDTMEESEGFYNFLSVKEKLAPNILSVYTSVKAMFPNTTSITIYGELFGGGYPHKDFSEDLESCVQVGVYYAPDLQYAGYDIYVHEDGSEGRFLNACLALHLLDASQVLIPPVEAMGSFAEMCNLPIPYESKTAARLFSLPPIERNFAEGYVIKTVANQQIATDKKPQRVIFKRKLDAFAEVMKTTHVAKTTSTAKGKASDALRFAKTALLNGQMLASAQSKAGKGKRNQQQVVDFFLRDVEEALAAEGFMISEEIKCLVKSFVDETI